RRRVHLEAAGGNPHFSGVSGAAGRGGFERHDLKPRAPGEKDIASHLDIDSGLRATRAGGGSRGYQGAATRKQLSAADHHTSACAARTCGTSADVDNRAIREVDATGD